MDTQKLHDLIDKVIGKNGPLRTPAYWMRRVLNKIVGHVDDKVAEARAEIDNELKGKLDRAIPLTYKEFRNMCYKKAGIEGQYYHISDYKPTLSELQEGFNVMSPYEGKLYVKYNNFTVYSQSHDYGYTTFRGYLLTEERSFDVDYIVHDDFAYFENKWMMRPLESLDTIEAKYFADTPYNGLKLKNKASINEGKNEEWLFEDVLTHEEYELLNYALDDNVISFSMRKVGDTFVVHDVIAKNYEFRTYGAIIRMKDYERNIEACYDFNGIIWTKGKIASHNARNIKISGYPKGFLPHVSIGYLYSVDGVEIVNSDNILIDGTYVSSAYLCGNLQFTNCYDINCYSCSNTVLNGCQDMTVESARNCYFEFCSNIESTKGLMSSTFIGISSKKIENVSHSFLSYVDAEELSSVIGIGIHDVIGKYVAIKDGQLYMFYKNSNGSGANPVYPKTTTSAVIDEATGKTLAGLIEEIEARLNTLEGK